MNSLYLTFLKIDKSTNYLAEVFILFFLSILSYFSSNNKIFLIFIIISIFYYLYTLKKYKSKKPLIKQHLKKQQIIRDRELLRKEFNEDLNIFNKIDQINKLLTEKMNNSLFIRNKIENIVYESYKTYLSNKRKIKKLKELRDNYSTLKLKEEVNKDISILKEKNIELLDSIDRIIKELIVSEGNSTSEIKTNSLINELEKSLVLYKEFKERIW